MNPDLAVQVTDLGKRFQLGANRGGYTRLTETLSERFRTLGRPRESGEFWALREISFEVHDGETVGIIGHNGAGKSTLFKILARIMRPTVGEARLRGRVGALLEVGTGFHPELTGRDNVFLNGAILNMSRAEIARKFEEIVEFADIGPFIDTPVKRYSSGMQLRLAFSVAAHLEPEILIVDEVLAVGDLAFQQKCLARMETASREGRTVLFISHNLASVRALCDRAMMLADGRIEAQGKTHEVIDAYVSGIETDMHLSLRDRARHGAVTGALRFTDIWFERNGRTVDSLVTGEDHEIVISYESADGMPVRGANFGITVATSGEGTPMLNLYSETTGTLLEDLPSSGQVRCRLPRLPLPAGQYFLNLWTDHEGEMLDSVVAAVEFTVAGGDFYGSGREPTPDQRTVLVEHSWTVSAAAPADLAQSSSSST